eukprot:Awhi_evm1s4757
MKQRCMSSQNKNWIDDELGISRQVAIQHTTEYAIESGTYLKCHIFPRAELQMLVKE